MRRAIRKVIGVRNSWASWIFLFFNLWILLGQRMDISLGLLGVHDFIIIIIIIIIIVIIIIIMMMMMMM